MKYQEEKNRDNSNNTEKHYRRTKLERNKRKTVFVYVTMLIKSIDVWRRTIYSGRITTQKNSCEDVHLVLFKWFNFYYHSHRFYLHC